MAHELDFSKGRAAHFNVRETAWHRLGITLPDHPSLDEALQAGGMDFGVEKRPYYRPVGVDDYLPSQEAFYIVRTDTGAVIGPRVGPDYTALQNRAAFEVLEPLVDAGLLLLDTGGALRGGADVWLQGVWNVEKMDPIVREVFRDEVETRATVVNNHNGTRAVQAMLTPVRIVCANTLAMGTAASRKTISVKHTRSAGSALVKAAEGLFGAVASGFKGVAEKYAALKLIRLTEEQFKVAVLDEVSPIEELLALPRSQWTNRTEGAIDRAKRERKTLSYMWTKGTGHTGDHSAWEAFGAVTESLDHRQDVFKVRGGNHETVVLGATARLKDKVLDNLLAVAK